MADQKPAPGNGVLRRHPLIRQLGELTADAVGVRLRVVYPTPTGWSDLPADTRSEMQPEFCNLFLSTREGAKHCRMCHVLMTVAACRGGPVVQRCHAGASVLVFPAAESAEESEAMAVVSSCTFAGPDAWVASEARGKALGVDEKRLRQAFQRLPKMSDERLAQLTGYMQAMSLAVRTVKQVNNMEQRLSAQEQEKASVKSDYLERLFRNTKLVTASSDGSDADKPERLPVLIGTVCELVRRRPDLPLTVKKLAAAARMTPNHFTALFSRWVGRSFNEYLTDQRIERARKLLLENATLNIAEVARMVGYDDPGYFSRRFRQRVGMSPRQWRERGGSSQAQAP